MKFRNNVGNYAEISTRSGEKFYEIMKKSAIKFLKKLMVLDKIFAKSREIKKKNFKIFWRKFIISSMKLIFIGIHQNFLTSQLIRRYGYSVGNFL